jgi:hypothetical protein
MDKKIKNLKSKKPKKKNKKTIQQKLDLLYDEQKKIAETAILHCGLNSFNNPESNCCPGLQVSDSFTFWPRLHHKSEFLKELN